MSGRGPVDLDDGQLASLLSRRAQRLIDKDTTERLVTSVLRATRTAAPAGHLAWPRLSAAIGLTAVLVLVVLAISVLPSVSPPQGVSSALDATGPATSLAPSNSPSSTSDSPSSASDSTALPAAPSTSAPPRATLITVDQLEAVLSASMEDDKPRDVIVDADVDVAALRKQGRRGPACVTGSKCAIGLLTGTGDDVWVTVGSDVDASLKNAADLISGPLALRVRRYHSLELLGVIRLRDDGSVLWPAEMAAVQPLPAGPGGPVIAVHGFLAWSGPLPCPASAEPTPPPDTPFEPCPSAWVSPQAFQPWSGNSLSAPPVGIRVQGEAYPNFVPGADQVPGPAYAPVEDTYLLRLVADPRSKCDPCSGWKVVGRLAALIAPETPGESPSVGLGAPAHILSPSELWLAIDRQRTSGTAPMDVVADVSIDRRRNVLLDWLARCDRPLVPCNDIGVINELTNAMVVMRGDAPYPDLTRSDLTGPVALRLIPGDPTIQFLGHVDPGGDRRLSWSVPAVAAHTQTIPFGHVLVVEGWLAHTLDGCGPPRPQGAPIEPPFNCFVADVLAPSPDNPPKIEIGTSDAAGLGVQMGAYAEFAPEALSTGGAPRYGTYLIQHVANNNDNCVGCDGWLMIGRLDSVAPAQPGVSAPLLPDDPVFQHPSGLALGASVSVEGWLVDNGAPVACPTIVAPTAAPADIWESSCFDGAWITRDEFQPVTSSANGGVSWSVPANAVRVQPEAYQQFARSPALEPDGVGHVPYFGIYTLQLIRDPRFLTTGAMGWQVTARTSP